MFKCLTHMISYNLIVPFLPLYPYIDLSFFSLPTGNH